MGLRPERDEAETRGTEERVDPELEGEGKRGQAGSSQALSSVFDLDSCFNHDR